MLDSDKVTAVSFFHAPNGSDNTSAFAHKGKKSMWDAWKVFPEVTQSFVRLVSPQPSISEEDVANIERYIVILLLTVRQNQRVLRCRPSSKNHVYDTGKTDGQTPPSPDALLQHIKRCAVQAGHI